MLINVGTPLQIWSKITPVICCCTNHPFPQQEQPLINQHWLQMLIRYTIIKVLQILCAFYNKCKLTRYLIAFSSFMPKLRWHFKSPRKEFPDLTLSVKTWREIIHQPLWLSGMLPDFSHFPSTVFRDLWK